MNKIGFFFNCSRKLLRKGNLNTFTQKRIPVLLKFSHFNLSPKSPLLSRRFSTEFRGEDVYTVEETLLMWKKEMKWGNILQTMEHAKKSGVKVSNLYYDIYLYAASMKKKTDLVYDILEEMLSSGKKVVQGTLLLALSCLRNDEAYRRKEDYIRLEKMFPENIILNENSPNPAQDLARVYSALMKTYVRAGFLSEAQRVWNSIRSSFRRSDIGEYGWVTYVELVYSRNGSVEEALSQIWEIHQETSKEMASELCLRLSNLCRYRRNYQGAEKVLFFMLEKKLPLSHHILSSVMEAQMQLGEKNRLINTVELLFENYSSTGMDTEVPLFLSKIFHKLHFSTVFFF